MAHKFLKMGKHYCGCSYAALVCLMNNIEQITSHPRLSNSLDNKQIQSLQKKAGLLLDFIEGYNYGGGNKEAEDLERRIASAAHAAEDVIESHIVHQIHAGTNKASLRCLFDLQQIIEDMERANELKEKLEGLRDQQPTHSRPRMESGESGMVGFEEELIQLMDDLTGQQSNRQIISIVGMGGMGKTTLARTVYQNLLIMQHFDVRAWAKISQHYNLQEILSQLHSIQGESSHGNVDKLGEQLHKTLSGRRYLIILDDIWSVDIWDKVRRFLPDNGNGSRIVLTTRLSNVANDCGSSSITNMKLLDEDKSWKLFCEKAQFPHEDCLPELEEVGKEIVESCKGLPLSIVVIGGRLLKSPRTVVYWKYVARDMKSIPNSKETHKSLDALFSSYNHLPPHLKPCFLYTGVYKSGYSEIRVSKMIKLWVAEGFLKSDGARVLEEIAEDYLKDLIDRNLILAGTRGDNGKMKSCDIHDLLRDLCLKEAEQQGFVHVCEGGIRGTERRLIFGSSRSGTGPPLARSIMGFRVGEQELDKQRLLRVLNVRFIDSPEELFECVNLRYLAFRHPGSPLELPTSVSLPWNLQSLIITSYLMTIVAPTEIWKMRQLRHMECPRIYLPDPSLFEQGEGGCLILENLQTLKTAVNLRLSEEACKIIPNIKKLHLVYDGELQGYDDCLIECLCNVDRFHKLESLNMSIKGSRWPALNRKLRFPSSLNKLSLSQCFLDWDDLTMIGSLPRLRVLNLGLNSVAKGREWSPVEGQFLGLKCLKIDRCDLVCWNAESCHFPILEKLVVCNLWSLKEIPCGIGEIPTLELIRVEFCSESAAISAVKIKEDQLDNQGNDRLQIEVKILDSCMESLREMVETEGLTIDNIQLEVY